MGVLLDPLNADAADVDGGGGDADEKEGREGGALGSGDADVGVLDCWPNRCSNAASM